MEYDKKKIGSAVSDEDVEGIVYRIPPRAKYIQFDPESREITFICSNPVKSGPKGNTRKDS